MKHHLLPFLGAATILAIAGGSAAFADPYSNGDCNCDGIVNWDDYLDILEYYDENAPAFPGFGDANHDGVVNGFDSADWIVTEDTDYRADPISGMDLTVGYAGGIAPVTMSDDNNSNLVLMADSGVDVWEACGPSTSISPSVSFSAKPDGYDIIYTFDNSSSTEDKSPGSLVVPGIALASTVKVRNFAYDGQQVILTGAGCCHALEAWPGPYVYSPVAVMSNSSYTIGASIQYPVLNYQHTVRVEYSSYTHMSSTFQRIEFLLGNCTDGADIPAGQSRAYTVSVRVLHSGLHTVDADDQDWMRTLQEYRRYFRCMYQAVQYERDARPVAAAQLAAEAFFGTSSHGYHPNWDPAGVDGWENVADWCDDRYTQENYHRVMIWTPTGFQQNENNYPFRFTSEIWNPTAYPANMPDHPIRSTLGLIRDVADESIMGHEDRSFGLWWGRAAQVPDPFEWNAEDQVNYVLDPTDLSMDGDVERALTELDYAVNAGYGFASDMIGLDAFTYLPLWQSFWWIKEMQSSAPGVKFITEGRHCDIMHTLAATYDEVFSPIKDGAGKTIGWSVNHTTPCYMADFLNPGHEFWVSEEHKPSCPPAHRMCVPSDWGPFLAEQAALGFVLRVAGNPSWFDADEQDMSSNYIYHAAETWLTTVPSDLQP